MFSYTNRNVRWPTLFKLTLRKLRGLRVLIEVYLDAMRASMVYG